MAMEGCFIASSSDSEWYEGLQRSGSCLKLYDLVHENRELIHELGPEGITVLHKGVDHGCVKLVRFVLVDMFNEAGMCNCKGEGNGLCALTREGLLRKTTEYGSTAVNMAIVSGSPKMVLLLEWAIRVSSKDKKIVESVNTTSCPVDNGELLRIAGLNDRERAEEIEPVVNVVDEVPDVKDDEISESIYLVQKYCASEKTYINCDMQLEVYKIIAANLNEGYTGEVGVVLNFLKERCAKDVDFEFVPVEHIFLHFLIAYGGVLRGEHPKPVGDMISEFGIRFFEGIVAECKMWDEKSKTVTETMQMTLFSIHDPRGRTIMHTLFYMKLGARWFEIEYAGRIDNIFRGVASESGKRGQCYTAKDGAGRTLYHMASIYGRRFYTRTLFVKDMKPDEYIEVDIEVTPLCYNEFRALQLWSFEETSVHMMTCVPQIPIYLAVLFGSEGHISRLLRGHASKWKQAPTPFQMASALGRSKSVEQFLKHQVQFKSIHDGGFHGCKGYDRALHIAAASGQAEVIQMILKYPIYDPMCQDRYVGDTALHILVGMKPNYMKFEDLKIWALHHVLPSSNYFKRIEGTILKHEAIKSSPRDFTKDEKICINLLLQAGIDMWTPNKAGDFPNVGSNANNEARSWWYDKVVKEVELKKASITSAANATSVVGALVATTSFIGPLQPPLSYSPEGYVNANPISIRIYLVCNSISFFFSIASILMAVLPSIPMPKESLYEEMIRSERCLKAAITLLLISIICILVSFSSASLAVVSSQWHDRKLIVASMIIGGGVCVVVLVIFIIRLIRMVFHQNSWLRRKFAKHMYF